MQIVKLEEKIAETILQRQGRAGRQAEFNRLVQKLAGFGLYGFDISYLYNVTRRNGSGLSKSVRVRISELARKSDQLRATHHTQHYNNNLFVIRQAEGRPFHTIG
ncbi:hypothetical protein ES706_03760 [subsurface metagenome]